MSFESPCLSLAVNRLVATQAKHYAISVIKAPFPSGYGFSDRVWTDNLTQTWHAWQELFSSRGLPNVPYVSGVNSFLPPELAQSPDATPLPLGGRLMQHLGISLWQWLLDGQIKSSFNQSRGYASGQLKPLRLRLEIRDPELIPLPWEIMQEQVGKQAISLSQQVLFSRTTSDVDPLPPLNTDQTLSILLVLGQDSEPELAPIKPRGNDDRHTLQTQQRLKLEQEAAALRQLLEDAGNPALTGNDTGAQCQVHTLVQPSPAELIQHLETEAYNVLFYAGHGMPAPDGGLLFLRPDTTLNGTELAQVLTRCRIKLAVFNACWGAQPDEQQHEPIPRSSLAEVLIHHGVPAVLGMRDSITDQEARSFIEALARALVARMPIDQAVAVARQQLLTLYRFNQPAWTLPVLYMHPDFEGELIQPLKKEDRTIIPSDSNLLKPSPSAYLRTLDAPAKVWRVRGGVMRIGRNEDNDLVIRKQEVSRIQAEIFCRDAQVPRPTYFLRDVSSYGTWMLGLQESEWQRVHQEEVTLEPGTRLKFDGRHGEPLEFVVEYPETPDLTQNSAAS
jgi:hypothetical protein